MQLGGWPCLVLLLGWAGSGWCQFEDLGISGGEGSSSSDFAQLFSKCVRGTPEFDHCIKDAINNARAFYTTGVPELNLPPIDPWNLDEVEQYRSSYEIKLTNIQESSWAKATIYKFKSSLKPGGYVQFTQFAPITSLEGEYRALGKKAKGFSEGRFNFTLHDMHRTILITRNKLSPEKLKVKHSIHEIGNAKIYISNLADGRVERENFDNLVINSFWKFGFPLVRPLVEELLDSAYSKKYTEIFANFNWDSLLPPASF
ncbi:hypothetical protein M8J77_019400 [Diaphorina citri]|nr:hypothetical protein M8J77_019400 [Diaphorina citri]